MKSMADEVNVFLERNNMKITSLEIETPRDNPPVALIKFMDVIFVFKGVSSQLDANYFQEENNGDFVYYYEPLSHNAGWPMLSTFEHLVATVTKVARFGVEDAINQEWIKYLDCYYMNAGDGKLFNAFFGQHSRNHTRPGGGTADAKDLKSFGE